MKRFSLRHLKDFGFGKADMGGLIMQEVEDLVIEMRSKDTVQVGLIPRLYPARVIKQC